MPTCPDRTALASNNSSILTDLAKLGPAGTQYSNDFFVNGTLIAHGEVVVVNEKFGIRLTDVISPSERIRKLR